MWWSYIILLTISFFELVRKEFITTTIIIIIIISNQSEEKEQVDAADQRESICVAFDLLLVVAHLHWPYEFESVSQVHKNELSLPIQLHIGRGIGKPRIAMMVSSL